MNCGCHPAQYDDEGHVIVYEMCRVHSNELQVRMWIEAWDGWLEPQFHAWKEWRYWLYRASAF
jgi:hypothetical protein